MELRHVRSPSGPRVSRAADLVVLEPCLPRPPLHGVGAIYDLDNSRTASEHALASRTPSTSCNRCTEVGPQTGSSLICSCGGCRRKGVAARRGDVGSLPPSGGPPHEAHRHAGERISGPHSCDTCVAWLLVSLGRCKRAGTCRPSLSVLLCVESGVGPGRCPPEMSRSID